MKKCFFYFILFTSLLECLMAQTGTQVFIGLAIGKDFFLNPKYITKDNTYNNSYYNQCNYHFELGFMKKNEICFGIDYCLDFGSNNRINRVDPTSTNTWTTTEKFKYGFLSYGVNYKFNFKLKRFEISPLIDVKLNTIYSYSFVETYGNTTVYSYSHNEFYLEKDAHFISYELGVRLKYNLIRNYLSIFYTNGYRNCLFAKYSEMELSTPTYNTRIGINFYLNNIFRKIIKSNKDKL